MSKVASYIDHTLLRPDAACADYAQMVQEALKYKVKAVCVQSALVPTVSPHLQGSKVQMVSVIGFPSGCQSLDSKLAEIRQAVFDGAVELDVVAPLYAIKSANWDYVRKEIKDIRDEAPKRVLKMILECGMLTPQEIEITSKICIQLGIDFLKTSTGVNCKLPFKETLQWCKILVDLTHRSKTKVKASGGICTQEQCRQLIDCGVSRIGTSKTVQILEHLI